MIDGSRLERMRLTHPLRNKTTRAALRRHAVIGTVVHVQHSIRKDDLPIQRMVGVVDEQFFALGMVGSMLVRRWSSGRSRFAGSHRSSVRGWNRRTSIAFFKSTSAGGFWPSSGRSRRFFAGPKFASCARAPRCRHRKPARRAWHLNLPKGSGDFSPSCGENLLPEGQQQDRLREGSPRRRALDGRHVWYQNLVGRVRQQV